MSDRQILLVYLAERDEDGDLILECDLAERRQDPEGETRRRWNRERPDRAGKELPSVEEMQIPDEVIYSGVQMAYVLVYWQVWMSRGLTSEHVLERWRQEHGTRT